MRSCLLILFLLSCVVLAAQDSLVPFSSSNLPIIVINTNGRTIPDDPKIDAEMGIIYNGTERNSLSDPFNDFNGRIGIEIRGSSSQMFPKKQYGIELRDDSGEGISAPLLGMPEEEDWVLFAPYNDKSLLRDALAYGLGRQLTGYAPRAKYCEVVLNNVYQGVYLLIEKIKRDKNRVDINKLDPEETTGDNLTGGYIIKIDKTTGDSGDGWTSEYEPPLATTGQTIFFQYEYPDASDIAAEQKSYIQSYIKSFEDVLVSDDFADPVNGYSQYIDVDSFIDYLIIQEVTRNVDAYRLSTFLYKQRDADGGRLHMGPIWDFNLAFGNADYCMGGETDGWALDFNSLCPADYWLVPFWWKRLLTDENFGARVASRWASLRTNALSNERIQFKVDSMTTLLEEAQVRNFAAWQVLGKYVWPNQYVGNSFAEEVTWLKNWINQRMSWMDANMPALITSASDNPELPRVIAFPNPFTESVQIRCTLAKGGAVGLSIYDLVGREVENLNLGEKVPGEHIFQWTASDENSGLLYFQITVNGRVVAAGKILHQ